MPRLVMESEEESAALNEALDGALTRERRPISEKIALGEDGYPARTENHCGGCGALIYVGYLDFNGLCWLQTAFYESRTPEAERLNECHVCGAHLTPETVLSMYEMDRRIYAAREAEVKPVGRGGLPSEIVSAMYADYARGYSIEEVGALYGRTRQSVWDVFNRRVREVREKPEAKFTMVWEGKKFATDPQGYLRQTTGHRDYLHKMIWRRNFGKTPAYHSICFKDGNPLNVAIENLELRADREVLAECRKKTQDRRKKCEAERKQKSIAAVAKLAEGPGVEKYSPKVPKGCPPIEQLYSAYKGGSTILSLASAHDLDPRWLFESLRVYCATRKEAA